MQPRHLAQMARPSDAQISPDGSVVVFTVTRLDLDEDRTVRTLWLWDGLVSRQFTDGPSDRHPRWSPDGTQIAFLRSGPEADDKPQVAVVPSDDGEVRVLSELPLGCEELAWSPDGSLLAFVGISYTDEWSDLDEAELARKPRRITRIPYRFDNKGWTHDRRRHVWIVPADGSRPAECVTPGDFDETMIAWKPDGSAIGFLTDRSPRLGLEDGTDLYEVEPDTGSLRRLGERGSWSLPTYRSDGAVHAVGNPVAGSWPHLLSLWRIEDGIDLTGHLDRNMFSMTLGLAPLQPCWVGDTCISVIEDAGRVGIIKTHADGTVDHLVDGDRAVHGVTASRDGSRLAFAASTATDPGEVYLWEDGVEQAITQLNAGFRADVPLVAPEHFQVASGGVEIDVWAYLPEGTDPLPLLLNIHGGPASAYGFGFFDEFQVYAGAGYGVVACNPRGSSGRGLEFVRGVVGDGWGVVDVEDVTAVIEEAKRRFTRFDGSKMGVMGGSYGGFLTAWLIALDHRFDSAIVERALLSFTSFAGTSDIGATFPRMYLGARLSEDPDRLWTKSPLSIAHQIETPTLLLHSEDDFRCPIEQAEQLFMILRDQDVDAELLRFPGEGHELSRSGKPRHRVERFEAVLDWHGRYLKGTSG